MVAGFDSDVGVTVSIVDGLVVDAIVALVPEFSVVLDSSRKEKLIEFRPTDYLFTKVKLFEKHIIYIFTFTPITNI